MDGISDSIRIVAITRENWEAVLDLQVKPEQREFVPSPAESLAVAYIRPWDEAVDPYAIYMEGIPIGLFYLSYTPGSKDNYWIGGFLIDMKYQHRGYGKAAMAKMLEFVLRQHPACEMISLTVEKENVIAQNLYKSMGFADQAKENKYGEIIYVLQRKDIDIG